MATALERIGEKARHNKQLVFTSLAHHVTRERLWENLSKIPHKTAPGIDKQRTKDAKASFAQWSEEMLEAMHRQGYKPPPTLRVYIPKPGRTQKRPIAIPTVSDRALQKTVAEMLSAIYEEDFLDCSFGGRSRKSAHQALGTLRTAIMSKKVNYIFEADLKDFFGSLSQDWVERFLLHRVRDPRLVSVIKRWLKAGVMEEDTWQATTEGTVQGGPISVLISNLYLHYVLDLWIEKIVKPRMRGEVYYIRYLDDFVVCFQYHSDAKRFQNVVSKRLEKFSLTLEPGKTKLIEFGRFAQGKMEKQGKRPDTLYFLGFTLYCSENRQGRFKVGIKTEKTRLRRSIANMKEVLRRYRHARLADQQKLINSVLLGHYRYYGIADNSSAIQSFYLFTKKYWRKMLSSRSQNGKVNWDKFDRIQKHFPLCKPKIYVDFWDMAKLARL